MVSAEKMQLVNIFRRGNRYTYIIPKYQRGFEWEIPQIDDFWDDLVYADKKVDKFHFFGTIFTTPEDLTTNTIRIVDGQQRITTCALFLLAVRDYCCTWEDEDPKAKQLVIDIQQMLYKWDDSKQVPDENSFVISLSRTNKNFFNQYLVPKAKPSLKLYIKDHSPNDSCEKLSEAYSEIVESIEENFGSDQDRITKLNHMVFSLLDRFQMIHVTVDDESSAYDMFNLINNRGIHLSESDLIKNKIFSKLDEQFESYLDKETRLDEYDEKWTDLRDNITGDKFSDYKLDNFFHHYLVAFKFKDSRVKEIFDDIKKLLEKEKPNEIVDHFFEWSKIFINLRNPEGKFDGSIRLEYYLSKIKEMKSTILYPVIMAGYQNYWEKGEAKSFARLVEVCFKWFIRGKTIGRLQASLLEEKMHDISYKIHNEKKIINQIVEELIKDSRTFHVDEILDIKLKDLSVSNSVVTTYLLEEIERTYDKDKVSGKDVTVEHIMPKSIKKWLDYIIDSHGFKGEKAEQKAKDLHSKYKNWIGNQTLLSDSSNKKNSNKPFDEKKLKYKDDGYKITQILAKEREWTESQIKTRQTIFAEKIEEFLDLTQYLEEETQ